MDVSNRFLRTPIIAYFCFCGLRLSYLLSASLLQANRRYWLDNFAIFDYLFPTEPFCNIFGLFFQALCLLCKPRVMVVGNLLKEDGRLNVLFRLGPLCNLRVSKCFQLISILYVEIGVRLESNKPVLVFVVQNENNSLIAQLSQFNCFINQASPSFTVGHCPFVGALNSGKRIYFHFSHV